MTAARLGMVELLDRDGAVAHRVPILRWPVTIGRSLDCDVLLDDPHAAPHHATLAAADDGSIELVADDSVNGVRLDGRALPGGARSGVSSGSEWQIGRTRLRLRLAGEALPPELPLSTLAPVSGRRLAGGLALLLIWLIGDHWLQSDPGEPLSSYLSVLLSVPLALGIWCFLWALGSKLFTRHFDFLAHLRWALGLLLAGLVLDAVLPQLAFALSWEWVPRAGELIALVLGAVLLYGHLALIVPGRRRLLALGFGTLLLVGGGLKLALHHQRTDRWFSPLYLSNLGPPALRLAPAVTPQQFVDEARRLREPLEQRVREAEAPGWLPWDED